MKIFREKTNSYVINLNGLPYEVLENNPLHKNLENERNINPEKFTIDEIVELPPNLFDNNEIDILKEKIKIQDNAIIELAEIISKLGSV